MEQEQRGRLAKGLQENQLLQEILDDMQGQAVAAWSSSSDREKQLENWAQYRAVARLRQTIRNYVSEAVKNESTR